MEPDPDVSSCSLLLDRNIFAPLVTNHLVSHTHTQMQAYVYTRTKADVQTLARAAALGNKAEKQAGHFDCVQIAGESDLNQIHSQI